MQHTFRRALQARTRELQLHAREPRSSPFKLLGRGIPFGHCYLSSKSTITKGGHSVLGWHAERRLACPAHFVHDKNISLRHDSYSYV